jgi:hypothetical protein
MIDAPSSAPAMTAIFLRDRPAIGLPSVMGGDGSSRPALWTAPRGLDQLAKQRQLFPAIVADEANAIGMFCDKEISLFLTGDRRGIIRSP